MRLLAKMAGRLYRDPLTDYQPYRSFIDLALKRMANYYRHSNGNYIAQAVLYFSWVLADVPANSSFVRFITSYEQLLIESDLDGPAK